MKTLTYFLSLLLCFTVSCSNNEHSYTQNIPEEPDYGDSTMWYSKYRGDSIDVFYVTPTCIFDWQDENTGITYHHYDVHGGVMEENFEYSLNLAEDIFASKCNFYAPYYRQISLESWTEDEDTVNSRFATAMHDINSAFDYYINHINKGRKFVLAGYSQGAKAVVELVKRMDGNMMANMKAAYVIGYRVDENDLKNNNIKPAEGECDRGKIICYSSVHTADDIWNIVSRGGKVCINPVNWRTDATPARLNDSITVTADTANSVLLVEGYDGGGIEIPVLKGVITEGNYHLSELTLYKDLLKENIEKRIR